MNKIPTVFVRDPQDRAHVIDEVNPGCEWVLSGEGKATMKWDGTCTMLDDAGLWWARREVKKGKTPPPNWVGVEADATTGKRVGWEPIDQSPFAKFHAQALSFHAVTRPGTYELVGQKINGNPHNYVHPAHDLVEHGTNVYPEAPRDFDGLSVWLKNVHEVDGVEGLVWWHPDGRRAKLKAKDFT